MRKNTLIVIGMIFVLSLTTTSAYAFWVWTPKTGKWVNPKYAVKATPEDQFRFVEELFTGRQYKRCRQEALKLIHYYPLSKEAAEAQFYIGRSLEELGIYYEAYMAYQKVVTKYPYSLRLEEVIKRQYQLADKLLSEKKKVILGVTLSREDMAIEILRSVVSNSPYGEYAAVAQYRIGLIQKGQGFFDDAKREFQKVVENYPESEWAKAAQFQMAACSSEGSPGPAYDQQTTQEAIAGFEEFVQAHPEAKLSEEAEERLRELKEKEAQSHYKIGIFYEKKKKSPEAAKVYYEYVIRHYPGSPWATQALERLRMLEKR